MRTLTVTGAGSATAVPDQALVRLAAVHRAASMADALAGAESARAAVVTAAGDLVVSSVDLSVWPANDAEGRAAGYDARHALTVATPDLATAGDLLGRLADQVGDRLQVEGVSLTVRDTAAADAAARETAFADARQRADQLAALAGATLAGVQSVVEGGTSGGWVPPGRAAFAKADVGLQPGETLVTAALTVTWELV